MKLRNVGISINGNWRYEWKWWLCLREIKFYIIVLECLYFYILKCILFYRNGYLYRYTYINLHLLIRIRIRVHELFDQFLMSHSNVHSTFSNYYETESKIHDHIINLVTSHLCTTYQQWKIFISFIARSPVMLKQTLKSIQGKH